MVVALAFVSVESATADPIPLTLTGPIAGNTVGPQSSSNPCIIAGTNCSQPAGFGYNDFTQGGNLDSHNLYSTTPKAEVAEGVEGTPYTVAQLSALGSTSFLVAIDVNTTGAAGETLLLFEVIDKTNNTVLYNYIGPTVIGNVNNNGNGYADWTLGTVNLAGLAGNTQILFHAQWNNASDGAESFFIVPVAVPTPEPASVMLLGLGISALGILRSRKRI
jgi:hypothetical protein